MKMIQSILSLQIGKKISLVKILILTRHNQCNIGIGHNLLANI